MRRLVTILMFLVAGIGLGFLTASAAVDGDLGPSRITNGPWRTWLVSGATRVNPYVRAHFALTGELPLRSSEVFILNANVDSEGDTLSGECTYRIDSPQIATRWWSLTVYDANGQLIETPARRYSFNSRNVMRGRNGDFTIRLSPQAQPGNWIPTGNAGRILVTLRLYNAEAELGDNISTAPLPTIKRLECV